MIKLIRTNSDNPDFKELVTQLDAYLVQTDGDEHSFYARYNKLDSIRHVILAFENEKPVACGAIKEYTPAIMEVKRMYTKAASRGKGIASEILSGLEHWAAELNYEKCILETGKRQEEAIILYRKNGYTLTPNYGQYAEMQNSLCFEKDLKSKAPL